MLKQIKLTKVLLLGKYRVDLYHDGEKVSSEEYWDGDGFDRLLERYYAEGYEECYTEKEMLEAQCYVETCGKYLVGGPKEWEFIGQDDNDIPIYKCPMCGRKQFGRSKYCGDCGNRLIWEEENG